ANNQTLTLTGNRPLVFAALSDVVVTGTIDARSLTNGTLRNGPGANWAGCGAMGGGNATTTGGGGGGAFGSDGGNGGGTVGGTGGAYGGSPELKPLHGGCAGGLGASGVFGAGGPGGGAVQVASATAAAMEWGATARRARPPPRRGRAPASTGAAAAAPGWATFASTATPTAPSAAAGFFSQAWFRSRRRARRLSATARCSTAPART